MWKAIRIFFQKTIMWHICTQKVNVLIELVNLNYTYRTSTCDISNRGYVTQRVIDMYFTRGFIDESVNYLQLYRYLVNIPPASPSSESLARLMTSSSESKVRMDITEPNTSSRTTVMWSSQLTRIQGLTKYPPRRGSTITLSPPHTTLAPYTHRNRNQQSGQRESSKYGKIH